jgi:hypothetical protein
MLSIFSISLVLLPYLDARVQGKATKEGTLRFAPIVSRGHPTRTVVTVRRRTRLPFFFLSRDLRLLFCGAI